MMDARTWLRAVEAVGLRAVVRPRERKVLAALLVWPALEAGIRAARVLDRPHPVTRPVFILGHQRSGTTFAHRLLALDPRFTAPSASQWMVPSAALHRAARAAVRLPGAHAMASRLEHRLFDRFEPWHTVRWSLPEEDDWLFLHAAISPTLDLLTAKPRITERYQIGDHLPPRERDRAMHWYRSCLERLPATGTLLTKNPYFLGWLASLNRTFPDARYLMVVRDPAQAIASWLAMATAAWGASEPVISRDDPRVEALFRASCARYRHAEEIWPSIPRDRKLRVRYDDLVLDPLATAERIHAHFDWPFEPDRFADAAERARRRVPGPRHQLRHFGVRPHRIRDELGDLDALWSALGTSP